MNSKYVLDSKEMDLTGDLIEPWFPTVSDVGPQGTLVLSGDIFGCYNLGGGVAATGN